MSQLGDRLRAERERIGFSQEEMAELGGVKRRSQINYEAGERAPDADYLARVASRIDVLFVLTGQRAQPLETTLSVEESTLIEHYRCASAEGRQAVKTVLAALASQQQPQNKD